MVRIQIQADIISGLVYHTRIITADPYRIACSKLTTMKHIIFQCGFCAEIIDAKQSHPKCEQRKSEKVFAVSHYY